MSDDWWDDFTNNLATDFAPLVALFGESPTKQYLSECLTATDILIFATAPLGVITAVVSAIRVCGTPSLRAFIGRAQEGAGNAEAELCSSTSRDVCELYNNGGIARVFGRPKLLEIVYDSSASLDDFFDNKEGGHPTAGIYSFEEFKNSKDTEEPSEWQEVYGRSHANFQTLKQYVLRQERRQNKEKGFAPNPNLSLNVGIKPRGKLWFYAAAAFGVALQSAVLVWAALARYWFHLVRHDVQDKYAVPFTIVGTIFLDFGVGLCAYLVERSTKERVFTRKYDLRTGGPPPRPRTRIYWVQPGNQVIGDQIFDSFAYTDFNTPLIKYTTSWKQDEVEEGAISTMKLIWAAVLFSLVGFVLQFIGLRACHSSVSLAQLAITVVMSIVRASLRTQRMEKKDNLTKDANLFQGHELDWLALEINRPTGGRTDWCKDCRHLWMVFSGHSSSTFQDYEERFEIEIPKDDSKHRILRLGFGSFGSRAPVGLCRIQDDGCNENQYRRIYNVSELHPSYPGPNEIIHQQTLEASTKSFFHRIRLARMTGLDDFDSSTSRKWNQTLVSVRHTAELLANAIEATASVLFITDTTPPIEIENRWKNSFAMFCPFDIAVRGCKDSDSKNGVSTSFFTLRREEGPNPEDPPEGPWQADRAELESILGLWTWSLMNRPGYPSQKSKVRSTRLFKESARVELDLWRQRAMNRIRTITLNLEPSSKNYLLQVDLKQPKPQISLWWNDGKKFVMDPRIGTIGSTNPPPSEADDIRQFYGLQDLDEPKASLAEVRALELGSTKSLMLACAQELYKNFFDTIMRTIKHIGGQTKVNKGRGGFYLANENIDRLHTAFVQGGLGSIENAFACIVPVLYMQKKLPPVSSALAAAREIATRQMREGEWEQASNVLELALQSLPSSKDPSSTELSAEVKNDRRLWVLTLCECYRGALKDEKMRTLGFSYKGISRLLRDENLSLTKDRTPLFYVDQPTLPAPTSREESATLARVLLNYAEAMVWLAESLGDVLGARLVKQALDECQMSGSERSNSRARYFLEAVQKGDFSSALYFLGSKDITATLDGRTALSYAAERGWFIIVEALTNANADIDARDISNRSSVYYAAQSGDINTFRHLIKNGASPNIRDKDERTALDCAADGSHLTIIQDLLDDPRVDPNPMDGSWQTPLTRAVLRGANKVVDILLSCSRVHATSRDKERLTSLMLAADTDPLEHFIHLVRSGIVNIRAEDSKGRTVLSRSALQGQRRYFQFLLKFDPSLVQTRDKSGRSPLSLAASGTKENEECDEEKKDLWKKDVPVEAESEQIDRYMPEPEVEAFSTMSTAIFRCDDYYDIMKELLRHPDVDPNERDDEGKTPLFHAVSAGNIGAVAQLLEKHDVDLNRADNCKNTPLAIAIANGSYGMVAYLLASPKIERSQVNSSGDSALSLAARLGHLFIVEQLLDHNNTLCQRKQCASGSNGMSQEESFDMASFVNCKVDGGDTPLIVACRAGQDAVALALLAVKGIGINDKGHLGDTALMATVRHGKDTIMDMLLSFEGVDVNEQNDDGDTPLIAAARYGRETAANRLLQRNDVQVNARNKLGETAFKIAVKCQSPVVHCLLDNSRVEKDTSDEPGNRPLLAAAQAGRHHMVMVLVESDIYNLESLDSSGRHLLSHAATYGWEDVVSIVLSKDLVNCKHSDQNGRDALSYAAASLYDPLSVVQRLIDRGFDPDLPDKNGRTPLSYAAENDCREILAYLLSLPEVSVDKPDTRGRTPLSYAVGRHNLNVVKRLLSIKEVEPDSMDKTNATPLLYAVLAVVNESPRIGNEKLLAARFSSRYQYIDRDAEVIKALLNSRRVNPDRTFSSDQYMPIHIAAALGYEEAVLALLPWVRPRERPVMQKFLGATDMDRVWDFVDANQGWKDRDEELYTRTGWVDVPTTSKLLRQPSWRSDLEEWVSKMAGVKDGKDRRRANH